jgi:hypothetical protein
MLCSHPPVDRLIGSQVEVFDIHPSSFSLFRFLSPADMPVERKFFYVFGRVSPWKGNCPLRNIGAPANALSSSLLIGEWTWSAELMILLRL